MSRFTLDRRLAALVAVLLVAGCGGEAGLPAQLAGVSWDSPALWQASTDGSSQVVLGAGEGAQAGAAVTAKWTLAPGGGWVQMKAEAAGVDEKTPVVFYLKAEGTGDLELKLVDADGSTFGRKIPLTGQYAKWTPIVIYPGSLDHWWGGDDLLGIVREFHVAVSGRGTGTLILDEVGLGRPGLVSSFPPAGPQIDPNATLPGIGPAQRRDAAMNPADSGVLAWLKAVQDASSPEKALLPAMEDNQAQTFNNALVAMAFLVEGEVERAERILDFYARATDRRNADTMLQNFFLKGQPRGFFQHVRLRSEGGGPAYTTYGNVDRWMGDMAWLLLACEHHKRVTGTARYKVLGSLLRSLLVSYYTPAKNGPGGYVQHGWRAGDARLHESDGHEEGNIDCYAVFQLVGETKKAEAIRAWLDHRLKGRGLPLDLYTWRAMAYGRDSASLLDIPEYDLRFRKTVTFNGKEVVGLYHGPDLNVSNIWTDGTGHMAVAHLAVGDRERGQFYANQLDRLLIGRTVGGTPVRALPYTTSTAGGYDWVKTDRGFSSCAAWYIFAKRRFNPLTLETAS